MQGNGCRKHLWCHCSLIFRRFLDRSWHHSHPWWIRNCIFSRICWRSRRVPQLFRSFPHGTSFSLASQDRIADNLQGWFIFTFLLLICTLRSTVAFFLLFFTLDLAFLMLGIAYLVGASSGAPNTPCLRAGGAFGILAAFIAWYNALAGIADTSNSFFIIPVAHFPWSDKGRERREKVDNAEARGQMSV